jgi:hypothetical protein
VTQRTGRIFLLMHVKFCENRSIRCGSTALLEIQYKDRPPSWIPHYANIEGNFSTGVVFCLCVSNFVKIGHFVPGLQHYFETQYGVRPPSWIPHYANIEVNLSTEVAFCLCVSNFVKIGRPLPSYAVFRNPIWRPVAILDSRKVRFWTLNPEQDAILR